jgi:probable F420-dependent oxidoreductase
MELGIVVPNSGPLGEVDAMLRIAERAEELGFAALWTADHLVLPVESQTSYPYLPGQKVRLDPRHPFVDPMIALAGIATRTRRIGLGISVYLAALRHPIVAAKLIASLDRLSHGRVRLGVGAGWIPEEYETLGIAFGERGRVLDDHLRCMRALWEQALPHYEGSHFRVDNIGFDPKPVQTPLPISIGGNSPAARRRAARLGDGWHVIDLALPDLERGIAALREECAAQGRPPEQVVVSMRAQVAITEERLPEAHRVGPLIGPKDDVVRDLLRMRELGVGHVALWPAGRDLDLETILERMERLATDIIPELGGAAGPRA